MISVGWVLVVIVVLSSFGWGGFGRSRRWSRGARLVEGRLEELESTLATRDAEMDRLHERVAELESRLDFTERLLAAGKQGAENREP